MISVDQRSKKLSQLFFVTSRLRGSKSLFRTSVSSVSLWFNKKVLPAEGQSRGEEPEADT